MGVIEGITDLITGSIAFALGILIVSIFLNAIRPTIAPLLENSEAFPNGVATLAIYDLVILVFAGIGLIVLILSAIDAGKQARQGIRDKTGF